MVVKMSEDKQIYRIFGGGPGGLYTAWRLLAGGKAKANDEIHIYDWGNFESLAGRIRSYHYGENPKNSFVELGGMRFDRWDKLPEGTGHRLLTTVVEHFEEETKPFNTVDDPLYFLRQKHFYASDIRNGTTTAPYETEHHNITPDEVLTNFSNEIVPEHDSFRKNWGHFFSSGTLPTEMKSNVYPENALLSNIGYWNLLYEQLGQDGYRYAADGNGYSSNAINLNSAHSAIFNRGEFSSGQQYHAFKAGYSHLFKQIRDSLHVLAAEKGVNFTLKHEQGCRSIHISTDGQIRYTTCNKNLPAKIIESGTADYVFLAMPPEGLDFVSEVSRVTTPEGYFDILNVENVALYRDAVIKKPSYKVAMFFDKPWWENATNKPNISPKSFGPTITDVPLRQIYYFGNNALEKDEKNPIYGVLVSYDDEEFTTFWEELEKGVEEQHTKPRSRNYQSVYGPGKASTEMIQMIRLQLAKVHFGVNANPEEVIPKPLETRFMNWSLPPFSAGYHGWRSHVNIPEVMRKIRKPTTILDNNIDANLFIVGSAYSADQGWVEGAFCTSESVLTEFLNMEPLVSEEYYPFIV